MDATQGHQAKNARPAHILMVTTETPRTYDSRFEVEQFNVSSTLRVLHDKAMHRDSGSPQSQFFDADIRSQFLRYDSRHFDAQDVFKGYPLGVYPRLDLSPPSIQVKYRQAYKPSDAVPNWADSFMRQCHLLWRSDTSKGKLLVD